MALGSLLAFAVRPLLYAGLVALVFWPLESLAPLRSGGSRPGRGTDALFATCGAILTRGLLFGVTGATLALSEAASGSLGLGLDGPLSGAPPWLTVPLGLVLFELGSYGYHRLAHAWAPLYRLHAVHHSAESMDWLAAFRQHPVEIALMTAAQNLPLVLLGMPLGAHALLVLLLRLNTVFVHSNLRTPRGLERLIATPAFHHRHHDRDGRPANFATLFPFIDRLFGTYAADEATAFGLPAGAELAGRGFLGLLLGPLVPRALRGRAHRRASREPDAAPLAARG